MMDADPLREVARGAGVEQQQIMEFDNGGGVVAAGCVDADPPIAVVPSVEDDQNKAGEDGIEEIPIER